MLEGDEAFPATIALNTKYEFWGGQSFVYDGCVLTFYSNYRGLLQTHNLVSPSDIQGKVEEFFGHNFPLEETKPMDTATSDELCSLYLNTVNSQQTPITEVGAPLIAKQWVDTLEGEGRTRKEAKTEITEITAEYTKPKINLPGFTPVDDTPPTERELECYDKLVKYCTLDKFNFELLTYVIIGHPVTDSYFCESTLQVARGTVIARLRGLEEMTGCPHNTPLATHATRLIARVNHYRS